MKLATFIVELLGVDVNTTNWKGNTMLTLVENGTKYKVIDFLLSHGANVNHQNKQKYTPLMLATERKTECDYPGYLTLQHKFIEAGASVTISNMWGLIPGDLDPWLRQAETNK